MDKTTRSVYFSDCDICGKHSELRPYGPNFEHICFTCGMKDEETTRLIHDTVEELRYDVMRDAKWETKH